MTESVLTTHVFEQGNSYVVSIPKQLCKVLGWQVGTELIVDIVKTNDEQVLILKK
jgi:antitoxin component of MazEF toxin-antitoxin module